MSSVRRRQNLLISLLPMLTTTIGWCRDGAVTLGRLALDARAARHPLARVCFALSMSECRVNSLELVPAQARSIRRRARS